jgi:drug/metabolite transporter (DMT)-like permease
MAMLTRRALNRAAVTLAMGGYRLVGRCGGWAETAVRWMDVQVIARVRAHPVAAAALSAVVLALPFVLAKITLEGYPPALVLLVFALSTSALFAFVVIAGAYLRVVTPRGAKRPAWLVATLAACTAATVAFAFHDSLLAHQTVAAASSLFFVPGLAAGAISFAILTTSRRFHANRQAS